MNFDAFISYSRAGSAKEARALKVGLERYARPWNKARSTRVFLDDASLSASPSLTGTLLQSLTESEWLIVLLTEEAAQSPWVEQEIAWWLQHKSAARMLLVHVSGTVAWEGPAFSAGSTALPPSLRGLQVEPRWVDLTWFSGPESLGSEDPRFAELVLQVFCPIHGLARDEAVALRDSNVRRAKRLTRAAIASLSTLLVLALVSAGIAVIQARAAQDQARLATARLLNSESQRIVDRNVGLSRLLAVQANSLLNDDQSRRSMFRSLTAGPQLVGEIAVASPRALATNKSGTVVVITTEDSRLLRWNRKTGRVDNLDTGCKENSRVEVSNDGQVIVGSCDDRTGFVYVGGQHTALGPVEAIAISPSGQTLAYLSDGDVRVAKTSATGVSEPRILKLPERPIISFIALRNDRILTVIDRMNAVGRVFTIEPWRQVAEQMFAAAAPEYQAVLSRSGEAYWDASSLWRMPSSGPTDGPLRIDPSTDSHDFVAMALSATGDTVAYASAEGSIEVTRPGSGHPGVTMRARLEAGDLIGPIAIGGSDIVVAGHDGVITVWDLRRTSAIVTQTRLRAGAESRAQALPGDDTLLIPNQDGSLVMFGDYRGITVMDGRGKVVFETKEGTDGLAFVGWRSNTEFYYIENNALHLVDANTGRVSDPRQLPAVRSNAVGWDAAAKQVLLAEDHAIHRVDPDSGSSSTTPVTGGSVVDISRDGSRILVASGVEVANQVWDSQLRNLLYSVTGDSALSFAANGDVVETPSNSGDSTLIAIDSGKRITLRNAGAPGATASQFVQFPASIDGSLYLTTENRGFVKIVARGNGQEWGRLPMELFQDDTYGEWAYAAFSGDGGRIFLVSSSGTPQFAPILTVVDVAPRVMVEAVCRTVTRGLGEAEWRQITGQQVPEKLACQP